MNDSAGQCAVRSVTVWECILLYHKLYVHNSASHILSS